MKVKSRYPRESNLDVRHMTLSEAKALQSGSHVLVLDRSGHWARAKVNGRPRTWKTRPLDCDIPLKYGMYEYFTESFRASTPETSLIVEL